MRFFTRMLAIGKLCVVQCWSISCSDERVQPLERWLHCKYYALQRVSHLFWRGHAFDPLALPSIKPNYCSAEVDRFIIRDGMRKIIRVLMETEGGI